MDSVKDSVMAMAKGSVTVMDWEMASVKATDAG
jgi:hypothetical protein